MAHVILCFPGTGQDRREYEILPLSLLFLAAPLVRDGHEVTIIDQRKEPDWTSCLRSAINRPQTIAAGISSMTGPQISHGLAMARQIRSLAPELPIVWGGVHPSLLPEQTVASPWVDLVVIGEGDVTFPQLINRLEKGKGWHDIPGLCYRLRGKPIRTPLAQGVDLETLPPVPYDLVDLNRYRARTFRNINPSLPIVTSRGCAFRCAYCYNTSFHQSRWKGLSPEKVFAEISRLATQYLSEGIFLLDDNFFGDRKRAEQILGLLIKNGLDINVYNANVRADFLYHSSTEYLKLIRRGGIRQVFVGIESGSNRVLQLIRKGITVEQVLEVNKRLGKAEIVPVYSFMVGLPGETWTEVRQTLNLMIRLIEENPQARLYKTCIYLPMPGTELYEKCREEWDFFPKGLEGWATYDYDHVNLAYLPAPYRRHLERISQLSAFLDVREKVGGVMGVMAGVYSGIARHRCRHGYYGWMPELAAISAFRHIAQR